MQATLKQTGSAALICIGVVGCRIPGPPNPNSIGHEAETQPAGPVLFPGKTGEDWKSYQDMHSFNIDRFVKSQGFGISRLAAYSPDFWHLYIADVRYHVGVHQLISPNDGKEPFAYVLDTGLPMTDRLEQAKHRPLTPAESQALEKLKAGDEIVWNGDSNHPVLIGAVRATTSCVKCHNVPEGTLLGAFDYPLRAEGK